MNANPRQAPLPPQWACRASAARAGRRRAGARARGRLDCAAEGEFTGRPGRRAKKSDNAPPSESGSPGANKFEILNFIQTCFAANQTKQEYLLLPVLPR
ncbi:hypothetical protein ANDA3_3876 [plant metagenome]|uniref:Uncharacterized protein n=1 Tax=plant metagenome TaxID=1297885 RepID=A0A484QCF7_9ZZZZ